MRAETSETHRTQNLLVCFEWLLPEAPRPLNLLEMNSAGENTQTHEEQQQHTDIVQQTLTSHVKLTLLASTVAKTCWTT